MPNHRALLSLTVLIVVSATLLLSGCGGTTGFASSTSTGAGSPSPTPAPTASPSPTPTPTPGPSPALTVLTNVEDSVNWLTCGSCGNTGGTGPVATFSFTPGIGAPSEDGRSTQFSIAATTAFSNAYWFRQQAPITSQINALTYEFDLYIPAGMETAPQAIEFECQQVIGGWVYNFAWQGPYHGATTWRTFDYGLKRWDASTIPFTPFTPGTWHHIVAEYHNDTANHVVFHDALTVDGVRFPVNITHNAFFSGGNNQFTNAFQLDSNSVPTPFSVYVDKMQVSYQ